MEDETYALYNAFQKILKAQYPGLKLAMYWSAEQNAVILSNIQVKDRRQGTGSEVMRRICSVADMNGHRIALSPDTSFGGSKAGLLRFYRRFGFVPNSGPRRDLSISESMIRYPVV